MPKLGLFPSNSDAEGASSIHSFLGIYSAVATECKNYQYFFYRFKHRGIKSGSIQFNARGR
jgi:hypothetical protein